MRACVYLLNNNQKYIKMASHSMSMLRSHNANIKIICLCLDELELPNELNVEKIKISNLDTFFFANKQHLADLDYESILFLDSDTFIFDDVEKIFENYTDDCVGCENIWCYGQGFNLFKPSNGGLILFNNKSYKKIYINFKNKLDTISVNYPLLNNWIESTQNHWTKEEFLASQIIIDLGLKHSFFDRKHCVTATWPQDFLKMKESIVFHTLKDQWKLGLAHSQDKKIKNFGLHRPKMAYNKPTA